MALQQKRAFRKKQALDGIAAAATAPPPRGLSTYRVGKIQTPAGQALCIVRMLSPFAIALDIEVPFAGADEAELVIGKETVTGALVFVEGKRAELRPVREIDPEAILADPSLLAGAGRRTLPRIEVDVRARLEVLGQSMTARICDISTDGVRVLVDDLLCHGDRVTLTMRGLQTRLTGEVRWAHEDHAGVEFDRPLAIGQLNLWLAAQNGPATAPAAQPDWGLVSRS